MILKHEGVALKNLKNYFIAGLLFFLLAGCQTKHDAYFKTIESWHQKRINALKKDTGWLTLAGLFWLSPGENSFGSDSSNTLIFPKTAPAFIGSFFLEDSTVRIMINPDLHVTSAGKPVTGAVLKSDISGAPTRLELNSLQWYVIRRGDKTGIRLKDKASPLLKSFTDIPRFPVQKSWRIKAQLLPAKQGHTIAFPNVLGQMEKAASPGKLSFKYAAKTHTLDVIREKGDDQYWIIFGDQTNGDATYGGGRFLYVDTVDQNGETYIDFNKAYDPPCVFTPFATCPLPPENNILDFKVTAGEKMFGEAHH